MDIKDDWIVQYDSYLREEMTPGEKQAFETRLAEDEQFRKGFDLHRALIGSLKRNQMRDQLRSDLKKSLNETNLRNGTGSIRWYWYVIGFGLLLALLFILNPFDQPELPVIEEHGNPTDKENSPFVDTTKADSVIIKKIFAENSNKNRPTVPETKEKERWGFSNKEPIHQILPVHLVAVRNGQAVHRLSPDSMRLTIHFWPGLEKMTSQMDAINLNLFLPDSAKQGERRYSIFELDHDGTSSRYLKIGDRYFAVPMGDDYPVEVKDKDVLNWLKK